MYTRTWATSERSYDLIVERDVKVSLPDGARLAKCVAATNPEPLKAIFAPFAGNDYYRHSWYHGGILAPTFLAHWRNSLHRPRVRSLYREMVGETAYAEAIARAKTDADVM